MYKDLTLSDTHLLYLKPYKAYWLEFRKIKNPDYDEHSKSIYYLKEKYPSAITKFFKIINDMIVDDDIAICYVPSHEAGKKDSGIMRVAIELSKDTKRVDATSCLVRHTTVPKLAFGGSRHIDVHLNSIKVINKHLIYDKTVLVLDDVTTSNNSLLACAELLMEAGASDVYCLALGQTM